ncbi:MAG: DUF2288 domain-containing protein [Gammaproteobacteria bacterium]
MNDPLDSDVNSLEKLVLETAKIPWKELQYFFASGHAVYVSTELDLVEVAWHIANDDKQLVENWMQAEKITPVSNDQARDWYNTDAQVWAVVVRPWVLIQDDTQGRRTQ